MLNDAQKVAIRRHLNYGAYGERAENSGWRFFTHFGQLEYRLSNLSVDEENVLLGAEVAQTPAQSPYFVVPDTDPEQVISGFLPICDWLEAQIVPVSDNLDTTKAGDWTARPDELVARTQLYVYWARRMGDLLYVPFHTQPWANPAGRLIA